MLNQTLKQETAKQTLNNTNSYLVLTFKAKVILIFRHKLILMIVKQRIYKEARGRKKIVTKGIKIFF